MLYVPATPVAPKPSGLLVTPLAATEAPSVLAPACTVQLPTVAPTVAVTCVRPPPADVTTPAALTVATAALPVDHVSCAPGKGSPCWSRTWAVSCRVEFTDPNSTAAGLIVIVVGAGSNGSVPLHAAVATSATMSERK